MDSFNNYNSHHIYNIKYCDILTHLTPASVTILAKQKSSLRFLGLHKVFWDTQSVK